MNRTFSKRLLADSKNLHFEERPLFEELAHLINRSDRIIKIKQSFIECSAH